jgi:hypothetical protein
MADGRLKSIKQVLCTGVVYMGGGRRPFYSMTFLSGFGGRDPEALKHTLWVVSSKQLQTTKLYFSQKKKKKKKNKKKKKKKK